MYIIGSEQTYEREPSRTRESKALQRGRERLPLLYSTASIKKVLRIYTIYYVYTHTQKYIKGRLFDTKTVN